MLICVLQRRAATWPAIPPSPRSHSLNWSPTRCACAVNGNFGNPSFPGPFLHGQVVFYLRAEFQKGSRSVCSDLLPLICNFLSVASDLLPLICYLWYATSDMLLLICYPCFGTSDLFQQICYLQYGHLPLIYYLWYFQLWPVTSESCISPFTSLFNLWSVTSDLLPVIWYLWFVTSDLSTLFLYLLSVTEDLLSLICYFWSVTSHMLPLINKNSDLLCPNPVYDLLPLNVTSDL